MRLLRIIPFLATLAVLAGCTSNAPVAGPPTTEATVSTPTPTPTEVGPVVAFGADCANVLTDAEATDLLGPEAITWADRSSPDSIAPSSDPSWPIARAGGLHCRWLTSASDPAEPYDDSENAVQELGIIAFPADIVADRYRAELADARCDPDFDTTWCRLGRTEGDVWLLARTGWYASTPPTALLTAALDAATARIAAFPAPIAKPRATGWWSFTGCDEFGRHLQLSDVLGPEYHSGYWEGSAQHEELILEAAGVSQFCQYSSDFEGVPDGYAFAILSISLDAGAGDTWRSEPADGETARDVIGAAHAFVEPITEGEGATLRATDGVNVLRVTAEGDAAIAVVVAERVLDFLAGAE